MTQARSILEPSQVLINKYLDGDDISSERALLTEILQKYEGDPWLRITNVEITNACNIGDNYMSTVQRAYVEGVNSNDKAFHKYLIMKRQVGNAERREMMHSDQIWANEAHMYFTVLPRLRRHCTIDLPHPKLYYSDQDLMVMEDLKDQGYKMCDRFQGLDLEHSLLVMKALALFHSSSLAMKILDDEMFNIMKEKLKHPYNAQAGVDMAKMFMQQALDKAFEVLKSSGNEYERNELLPVLEYLQGNYKDILNFVNKECWNRELSVVIHGDIWVNNILFLHEGNNTRKPKVCKFVDFQGTRMGSIATDIFYFIYTSVQPEVRKKHYDTLIQEYYDSLISYLREFVGRENASYVDDLSFDKFDTELKTMKICGLLTAVILLPVITFEDQTLPSSNGNIVFNITRSYEQSYKGRLVEVLEEYKNYGCV